MKRSVLSVSLWVLVCLVGSAAAQSAENVYAYKVYFMAEKYNWDMHAANVYCADVNGNESYEWRSKYYWTAFGDPNGPSGKAACGLCVNVTNTATGDEATVRIVATSSSGLDLDEPIFHKLDSDGQGEVKGHLVVDYKFVDCDPEPAGHGESNVTAYKTDYAPIANNWTYPSHAACYALDGGKPFEWRSKYGWTGYCGNYSSSNPEDICGKCLKVTNRVANAPPVTVRIMDTCGIGALELDLETGFKPIDPDHQGIRDGHLTVDYEFVTCGDELNSPLVYSQ